MLGPEVSQSEREPSGPSRPEGGNDRADALADAAPPAGVRQLARSTHRKLGVADTLPPDQSQKETAAVVVSSDMLTTKDELRDTVDAHAPPRSAGPMSKTIAAGDGDLASSAAEPLYDPAKEEDAVADPLIGLVVADRYRIIERIGRGGMGIVYRVEHIRIGKQLAMKLLAGELSTNKEIVRRFKNEALTVSKLSSPHTVQVFDYGVWNHLTYLVMELVDGDDLSRLLRRDGPMRFARLGRLVAQVCASIGEAHEKGIVHRDIKPENIMIIKDAHGVEVAKVLDFGLAKLREGAELNEVTLQGAVVGTPYFISPEQVYGEDVDQRTDIYSLGAVMFRALTGTYPFHAKTPMGMFTKHLTEDPPSAVERAPDLDIPTGVSRAIQRCMAKSPSDRFPTIEALRDVIVDELNALPLSSSDRLLLDDSSASGEADADERRKRRRRAVVAVAAPELAQSALATRKELERYERKLRRTRYGAWGLLTLAILGGAVGLAYVYRRGAEQFTGSEREPNNVAADANALPLGRPMQGYLGRRSEPTVGDRDFFVFDVPAAGQAEAGAAFIGIRVTSLPNIPMCSFLYRVGFPQPVAQFCTGAPSQDLDVAALRVEPGQYLLTVTQDMTQRGQELPRVYENVSDPYDVEVKLVEPSPSDEVEPNDRLESAQRLAAGGELRGTLPWLDDEDVLCVDDAVQGTIRWEVSDDKRSTGTVIEVTPMRGETPAPLVRVHPSGAQPFGRPRLDADVNSPWTSPPMPPSDGSRCVRLRLTSDPWVERQQARARAGATSYLVKVLRPDGGPSPELPRRTPGPDPSD